MIKTDFIKQLSSIFETNLNENSKINKKNFDSLKVLELISFKESKFKNLKIKPEKYQNCSTVKDLLKLFSWWWSV